MNKVFRFEAKSDTEVDIHIYGAIGRDESYRDEGTNNTAYALVSLIKRLDKSYGRINIHINSPGGDISEGLAIYNTLKQAKADIHTYNSGLVASMASILMLSGTSHMPKPSIFHLHRASTIAWGNVNDFQDTIDALEVFETTLKQAISDKTGLTMEEIQTKWFDGKEHYMTAEQANEFGFVDVLEIDLKSKAPASLENLQNMKFKQVIELYKNATDEKKEKSFLKRVAAILKPSNHENSITMSNKLVFKAKLTVLLALINLQEFALNDNNKVEMSIDEAYKVNDTLEANAQEIEALKQAQIKLEEQIAALNLRNDELQAKLDATPGQPPVNTKGGDNSKDKNDPIDQLDKETSASLHEYNRKMGLYK